MGDLYLLFGLGLLGWMMKHAEWPRAPALVGFVLAAPMEQYFWLSNQLHGWSWLTRPGVLIIASVILCRWPFQGVRKLRKSPAPVSGPAETDAWRAGRRRRHGHRSRDRSRPYPHHLGGPGAAGGGRLRLWLVGNAGVSGHLAADAGARHLSRARAVPDPDLAIHAGTARGNIRRVPRTPLPSAAGALSGRGLGIRILRADAGDGRMDAAGLRRACGCWVQRSTAVSFSEQSTGFTA
jgi:hypothetical protein